MFNFFTDSTKKRSKESEKKSFQCSLRRLSVDQGIGIPFYWQNVRLDLFPKNVPPQGSLLAHYFEMFIYKKPSIVLRAYYEYLESKEGMIFYLENSVGDERTTFTKIDVPSERKNKLRFDFTASLKTFIPMQVLSSVNIIIEKEDSASRWAIDDYWIGEVSLSDKRFAVVFQQYSSIYYRDIDHSKSWGVINTDHETFQVDDVQYKVKTNFLTGEVWFSL